MKWSFLHLFLPMTLLLPFGAKAEWICRIQSGGVSVGGGDMHQEPDVEICDWVDGGGVGGGGGGNGGGGGGNGNDSGGGMCAIIIGSRPDDCPNPIPKPSGPYYGEDELPTSGLPGGLLSLSSMRMVNSFAKGIASWQDINITASDSARQRMYNALSEHTRDIADGVSLTIANTRFRGELALSCQEQSNASNSYRVGITPTKAELYCFEAMKAFDAEAGDHLNFVQWFIDFTKSSGIPLEAYIPYGVVELTEANNSIGAKWRAITKGASCSSWWVALQANGCGAN
ncbi:hypothetical protein [Stenotrophomonas sp. WZN-1]|uniref:hypothetical protein n=1 Tax=Stenotrophomonas sp. WZN-1 TaxID=2005046 RepID=UPI0012FD4E26|nr:hypothetical protein [Stenotrophomonas sp. WZN-1]